MNPYEVLGVARDASTDEIKKVYRRLARETHPDLNPGDAKAEARFKDVSAAYDVLSDSERRRQYDEFGEVALQAGFDADRARASRDRFSSRFGAPDEGGSGEGYAFGGIEDLLRGFGVRSGGKSGARFRMDGPDVEASMSLGFVEAVKGGERRISIARPRRDGSQAVEEIAVRIPPGVTDGGRLRIPGKGGEGMNGGESGDLWINVRVEPHPVFRLDGRDLELELPITLAEAVIGGRVEVPTLEGRATVTVPPGTSSGSRLRLRGQGVPASRTAPAGDLWINVRVEPHPVFRRDGRDLELELPITLAEAVIGGRVEVPTLDGRATVTIPPGTSSGSRLRLRGQGVPASRTTPAGDLYARIKIVVPKDAAEKLGEVLRELAEEDPRKGLFP